MAEAHEEALPLAGRRILVTAQRRADDLAAPLVRRGAEVVIAPTLAVEKHIDEPVLLDQTRALISDPPQILIITTGFGLRAWNESAIGAGLGEQLVGMLNSTRVLARGPKASGALQQIGSRAAWVAASELSDEILRTLVAEGVDGVQIAVQLDGGGDAGLLAGLRDAGARVIELPVYRWGPPADPEAVARAAVDAGAGRYDAVAFTAAPGAAAWVDSLRRAGTLEAVRDLVDRDALRLVAVGARCAEPLAAAGLAARWPERSRLGPLAKLIAEGVSQAD
jgi:uroporphyrinogen-III synthase